MVSISGQDSNAPALPATDAGGPGCPASVGQVVRAVLAAVAPEELDDFEANAAAFFADPAGMLLPERSPDEPAGFGDVVIGLITTALLGGVSGLISDSLKEAVKATFVRAARARRWRKGTGPEAERVRAQAQRYARGEQSGTCASSSGSARRDAPNPTLSTPLAPIETAQIEPLVELVGALATLSNIPAPRTEALCAALRTALAVLADPPKQAP